MKEITKDEFNTLVYNTDLITEDTKDLQLLSDKPVIVMFSASWCGPCKAITPVLTEISESRTDLNIYKVDVDKSRELAVIFGVRAVPTILYLTKNSKQTTTGIVSKPQLNQIIAGMIADHNIDDATIVE
jgi:thioredoxin 1